MRLYNPENAIKT